MRKCLTLVSLAVVCLGNATVVWGQGLPAGLNGARAGVGGAANAQNANVPVPAKQIDLVGTVAEVGPNFFIVMLPNKQSWKVVIDAPQIGAQAKTLVTLRAPARTGVIQNGRAVRFVATLDQKQRVNGPIDKITVFSPPTVDIGIFSEEQFGAAPDVGGAGNAAGGDGLKEADIDGASKLPIRPQLPKDAPQKGSGRSVVIGVIKNFRAGELRIAPNLRKSMTFKIGPETQLEFQTTDRATIKSLLAKGDPVFASTVYDQDHLAYAKQVTFNLDRPVGEEERNPYRSKIDTSKENDATSAKRPPQEPFVPEEATKEPEKPKVVRVLKIN
jgi:hypothetical protein